MTTASVAASSTLSVISSSISASSTLAPTISASSTSTSTSSVSGSSATASTQSPAQSFTHSALFIFLLVLAGLSALAILGTLVSCLIRGKAPCCAEFCSKAPEDDEVQDDKISEISKGVHGETGSVISAGVRRRSELFAQDPRSPFLHSDGFERRPGTVPADLMPFERIERGTMRQEGWGNEKIDRENIAGFGMDLGERDGSLTIPGGAYDFQGTRPLQIRNRMSGDFSEMEKQGSSASEASQPPDHPRWQGVTGRVVGCSGRH